MLRGKGEGEGRVIVWRGERGEREVSDGMRCDGSKGSEVGSGVTEV